MLEVRDGLEWPKWTCSPVLSRCIWVVVEKLAQVEENPAIFFGVQNSDLLPVWEPHARSVTPSQSYDSVPTLHVSSSQPSLGKALFSLPQGVSLAGVSGGLCPGSKNLATPREREDSSFGPGGPSFGLRISAAWGSAQAWG